VNSIVRDIRNIIDEKGFLHGSAKTLSWSFKAAAKIKRILALSRTPIIIGGCGRSGTTLLFSILTCHPHIYGIDDETHCLCPTGGRPKPDLNAPLRIHGLYKYLAMHDIPDTCKRWCEKSPRNVLFFSRILDYFGEKARIINIVRDGRDVITSKHPNDPSRFWVSPSRWINDVRAGLRFKGHPQVFTMRYEDLVTDYEKTIRKICDFLQEEFGSFFFDFPKNARSESLKRVVLGGKLEAVHSRSVARWKQPEFVERISKFMSDSEAMSLMRHYGYLD
jgi:hypothetical protein